MRILIVYGYEPSGHASSARALEAAAAEGQPGLEVVRVNISGEYHPLMGSALAHLYLQIVQKTPGLWDYLYDNPKIAAATRELRRLYFFLGGRRLREKMAELAPDVVVCTHATPLSFLASLKAKGGLSCPLVGVITDYGVHSYWANPQTDLYLVPCREALESLAGRGVPREKIRVVGIPIHPVFATAVDRASARATLGLDPDRAVLLLSGGTRGIGALAELAEALLRRLPAVRILALCGSNGTLLKKMKSRENGRLLAFGELEPRRVRELMAASDLLIGKAGGLTIAECLALGLPMAFYEPIPGQEERNAEHLLRLGAAVKAESLLGLVETAAKLFEAGGLEPLEKRAEALGKSNSAGQALREIVAAANAARLLFIGS